MRKFMKCILEYLCSFNRFAIILLAGAGADAIADRYNFPWQIIVFIVAGLVLYDYEQCKKKRAEYLQQKTEDFIKKNRSTLSLSQIIDIQQLYK